MGALWGIFIAGVLLVGFAVIAFIATSMITPVKSFWSTVNPTVFTNNPEYFTINTFLEIFAVFILFIAIVLAVRRASKKSTPY
jgi:hypothetical protein